MLDTHTDFETVDEIRDLLPSCRFGHTEGRYTNGGCKRCAKIKAAAWRANNRERRREIVQAHKERNREAIRVASSQYYRLNAEECKRRNISWQKRNLDKINAWNARYRAAKRNAFPDWGQHKDMEALYKKGREEGLDVDHIVPLRSKYVCGLHVLANLQLLSPLENINKSNKHWPDMW